MATDAAKFPKRKLTAEQKKIWKSSPVYLNGVQKAQAREQSRLEKALKSPHTDEAGRIKANDRLIALEAEQKAVRGQLAEIAKRAKPA